MGSLERYYNKQLHKQRRVDETVDDILLEAKDIGIDVNIESINNHSYKKIKLSGDIPAQDVTPIVDRLCDYLKQEKFNPQVEYNGNSVFYSFVTRKHTINGRIFTATITY